MVLPVRCRVNLCHFTHTVGNELDQAIVESDWTQPLIHEAEFDRIFASAPMSNRELLRIYEKGSDDCDSIESPWLFAHIAHSSGARKSGLSESKSDEACLPDSQCPHAPWYSHGADVNFRDTDPSPSFVPWSVFEPWLYVDLRLCLKMGPIHHTESSRSPFGRIETSILAHLESLCSSSRWWRRGVWGLVRCLWAEGTQGQCL